MSQSPNAVLKPTADQFFLMRPQDVGTLQLAPGDFSGAIDLDQAYPGYKLKRRVHS